MKYRMQPMLPAGTNNNKNLHLLASRFGTIDLPHYSLDALDGTNDMATRLKSAGGFAQQRRMIQDKRRSLDKAMLYSYQAALVKKWIPDSVEVMDGEHRKIPPVRALINPDKLKYDYDDKIISTGFENDFHAGDVFEWCNTHTFWLIVLQDLTELAYFRADIRRCTQMISWEDEDGDIHTTFAAVRGPVETKIDYIQKHGISVDNPNLSLHILMPKTPDTVAYFRRYSKFYLKTADAPDNKICWRVEATDSISTPGILEFTAVEYYANEVEDDIENGIAGSMKIKPIDPSPVPEKTVVFITGETFIKPKKEYVYSIGGRIKGTWSITEKNRPVRLEPFENEKGFPSVKIKWDSTYSGQFELNFGEYKKTIVVESLF